MGAVRGWALLARRAQRSRGTERSVSLPFGVVVESARFQKAGPFYAFSEKGFSGQTAVTPKRANGRRRALPARGRFDLLLAVDARFAW